MRSTLLIRGLIILLLLQSSVGGWLLDHPKSAQPATASAKMPCHQGVDADAVQVNDEPTGCNDECCDACDGTNCARSGLLAILAIDPPDTRIGGVTLAASRAQSGWLERNPAPPTPPPNLLLIG